MVISMMDALRKNDRLLLICLLLALLTLATFWNVQHCNFVNLDDPVYVTENSYIRAGITGEGIRWAFSTTSLAGFWHPLTWISLMIDHELFGLKPGGYHLTNLLLHLASTLLLFLLFQWMTGASWRSAFVAALFAIHPLHVESVAWIAERKDTLSTFFWMLTLCAYVRYTKEPAWHRYTLALLCFACGLMSKPMLVTLPFVMILLDYWPLQRLYEQKSTSNSLDAVRTAGVHKGTERPSGKKPPKKNSPARDIPKRSAAKSVMRGLLPLLREKIPFFLLSFFFSAIAYYAQYERAIKIFPLSSRLANSLISYIVYIEKTFWPCELAVFYPFPHIFPLWKVTGAAILLLGISIVVITAAKRLPYLFVGWFWYAGILLPVIGIIQVGKHAMADRYTYIPLIGLFIMAAWGIPELIRKWRYRQPALFLSAALILSCFSFITWAQVGYWRDSTTLFQHALKVTTDNDVAHNNLGTALSDRGNIEEAVSHYREVLRINPDDGEAHNNLGNVFFMRGQLKEAEFHLRAALRFKFEEPEVYFNLGTVLSSQGMAGEAIPYLLKAISIRPGYGEAHFNLANALASQGMFSEAITHFAEVIRLNPNDEKAHTNMGRALLIQGRIYDAIAHFQEALRINPDLTLAKDNLREALGMQRRKR
jgi:protein O-mannosyl-transferase